MCEVHQTIVFCAGCDGPDNWPLPRAYIRVLREEAPPETDERTDHYTKLSVWPSMART